MNPFPTSIELLATSPGSFDELDVAHFVSKLGGSMNGKIAIFSDPNRTAAAMDELCDRFGSRYFTARSSRLPHLNQSA